MKILNLTRLAAITALAASAFVTHAATLKVGDPAPKLEVGKWVQGDAVTEFKAGTVYIVEFWATWCGPCRATIPHLNQTFVKFKDKGLVVVGQNVWEEDTSAVEPFIKKMGTNMTYRVALDSIPDGGKANDGKMAKNWMAAADQNGIPAAFLIGKDGKIAWIGHPMNLKEEIIEQVYAGTYDVKKAAAEQEKAQAERKELQAKQGEISKHGKVLDEAMKNKEWDKALEAAGEIEKLLPESRKSAIIPLRVKLLLSKGDTEGAGKEADKFIAATKSAEQLNAFAWGLSSDKEIDKAGLGVALKIAEKANEISEGKEAGILDTLARLNFQKGNKDKAIELQTKAVELAPDDQKDALKKSLTSYKEGKLPEVNE
jgi:thiol-disulfide isomerase/thioredoxin